MGSCFAAVLVSGVRVIPACAEVLLLFSITGGETADLPLVCLGVGADFIESLKSWRIHKLPSKINKLFQMERSWEAHKVIHR